MSQSVSQVIEQLGITSFYRFTNLNDDYIKVKHMGGVYVIHTTRADFVKNFSWAVPDINSIEKIVNFIDADVLSMGAGNGLWEYLIDIGLKNQGKNYIIRAIDNQQYPNQYYPVQLMDIEQLTETYPILFICWPDCTGMDITAVTKNNPNKIIYIGEENGGCTGCYDFHEALDQDYQVVEEIDIHQWMGVHDKIVLYTKKP